MARRALAAAALTALAGVAVLALSAAGAAGSSATSGAAAPTTVLERYLTGLKTLSTQFTQTVTDAHGNETEAGSGSLTVQRPDKFRWDYRPREDNAAAGAGAGAGAASSGTGAQSGQLMVADGKNLWFYDRELAQVTVKPLGGALSSTPIMLLSSTPEQLQQSFQITPGGTHDGLQWVDVKPRSTEADFSSAELGFEGERLARMIVHDNLGQTVRLDFSHSGRDQPLAPSLFQFKPPSGVDVIGTAH
jgi:outer membrane lipoprotein carrier protein